ncbi:hypothetical protein BJ322DRAFT_280668 [Thelephora terrestris]|uniref:Secreted protein n=1 Tax=Thelephora terrestris TaxID=56493 RepID=A0A9P6L3A2_9AGAM|nr:hypothetical protein BJ322DRAFT_280668 [Thelephora terrestris]
MSTSSLFLIVPLLFVKSPHSRYLYVITSPERPLDFPPASSTTTYTLPLPLHFVLLRTVRVCFLLDSLGGFFGRLGVRSRWLPRPRYFLLSHYTCAYISWIFFRPPWNLSRFR